MGPELSGSKRSSLAEGCLPVLALPLLKQHRASHQRLSERRRQTARCSDGAVYCTRSYVRMQHIASSSRQCSEIKIASRQRMPSVHSISSRNLDELRISIVSQLVSLPVRGTRHKSSHVPIRSLHHQAVLTSDVDIILSGECQRVRDRGRICRAGPENERCLHGNRP